MIRFIYGMAGTGKSTYIAGEIIKDLTLGSQPMLIVPEQQTVEAEERLTGIAEKAGVPVIGLEILNFTRLANRVFRRFGGLCYNYIGNGARHVVMWRALSELTPVLTEYRNITLTDKNMLRLMTDTVSEFRRYNITPVLLENAAETMGKERVSDSLKRKLRDLSLIYARYQMLLKNEYDDPEEDLTRLSVLLEKNVFFGGYHVYLDSFSGFTPQQMNIIRQMVTQADHVTITLPMLPGSSLIMLEGVSYTENKLKKIITDAHKSIDETIVLKEGLRFRTPELVCLEKYLWDYRQTESVFTDKTRHLKTIECNDIFCEAEAAAKDILRRIRQGGRFFDQLIVVRDTAAYSGVIDAVFEKYQIPYFMSERTDLKMKPPVKLILTALSVLSGNWRCGDVISYMKTGYSGITADECDTLELYVSGWNINGRRWTDDTPWNMNPDGYTDVLTDKGREILSAVHDIRCRLTAPLTALSASFTPECTVKEASEAIYRFLCDLDVRGRSEELGEDEPAQVWNIIMDTLGQIVKVAGSAAVGAEQYMRLLAVIFDEADIGRIPTSMDEVMVGGALSFRPGRAKNIYILGANEGKFPQNVADDGIFNDTERITLETYGIVITPVSDRRAADELYYFYRAAACVEENVTVLYSTADLAGHSMLPSPACGRLKILFPNMTTERYADAEPLDLIEGYEASFEYTAMYRGSPAGDALRAYYSKDITYLDRLKALDEPFIQPFHSVLPETSKELYGGDLVLTQAKLENYALCAFSYYCRYVLQLTENKRAEFKSVDTGNFIHRVLEKFMISVKTDSGINPELTDKEIETAADDIIAEYMNAVVHDAQDRSNRMVHLFRRLRRTAILLIKNMLEEFKQSEFIPAFFELPIKSGAEGAAQPFVIPLPDRSNAYIFGKVDRVDTYKKGNDVYIRVVDYKTGIRDFSLSDLQLGLNMQMLLYLFSLWQNPSDSFKKSAGCGSGGGILPAGVLYLSARAPEVSLDGKADEKTVTEMANNMLTRKGLLLDDREILTAMEKNLEGRYIPVKLKADGNYTAASPLQTLNDFGKLMRDISDTIVKLSGKLKDGQADALPLKKGKHNACEYCPHKPVCRIGDFN